MEDKNKVLKIFAAGMWIPANFGHPNERYRKFISRGYPVLKQFIDSILLYEEIVIPTHDYLALTFLIDLLGQRAIIELLETQTLKFARLNGLLAYSGNGKGIQPYSIRRQDGSSHAFCAPVDEAINFAISGLNAKNVDPLINTLVENATTEIHAKDLIDQVSSETYSDINNSIYLQKAFSLHNKKLDQLNGIEANQIRVYGGADFSGTHDEIDLLLILANTNLEIKLTESTNCSDSSTSSPIEHILKAKFDRSFGNSKVYDSLITVQKITGVPDIAEGVISKEIPINKLIKLSNSKNGQAFRTWFHENYENDSISIAHELHVLYNQIPTIESTPLKVIRFIVTSALGEIPIPGFGTIGGIVDSFFIDNWLRGISPKFFLEDMKQIE